MPPAELLWFLAAALLVTCALGCAWVAWQRESTAHTIHSTPTISTTEVYERHRMAQIGATSFGEPIELVGTLESDEELFAPESRTRCVAYDFVINEDRARQVSFARNRQRHTYTTGAFDTHRHRVQRCFIADATGRTPVDLAEAQIELLATVARYEHFTGLRGEKREVWREEWALPTGRQVYVLGYLTTENDLPMIARHPLEPERPFIVSYRDADSMLSHTRSRAYLLYLIAGLSAGGAGVALLLGLGVL